MVKQPGRKPGVSAWNEAGDLENSTIAGITLGEVTQKVSRPLSLDHNPQKAMLWTTMSLSQYWADGELYPELGLAKQKGWKTRKGGPLVESAANPHGQGLLISHELQTKPHLHLLGTVSKHGFWSSLRWPEILHSQKSQRWQRCLPRPRSETCRDR